MKLIIKAAMVGALALHSLSPCAEEINVYCISDKSGDDWELLPTGEKAQGYWTKTYPGELSGLSIKTFQINRWSYLLFAASCENYFPHLPIPKPAYSRYSDWHSFSFDHNQKRYYSGGLAKAHSNVRPFYKSVPQVYTVRLKGNIEDW